MKWLLFPCGLLKRCLGGGVLFSETVAHGSAVNHFEIKETGSWVIETFMMCGPWAHWSDGDFEGTIMLCIAEKDKGRKVYICIGFCICVCTTEYPFVTHKINGKQKCRLQTYSKWRLWINPQNAFAFCIFFCLRVKPGSILQYDLRMIHRASCALVETRTQCCALS